MAENVLNPEAPADAVISEEIDATTPIATDEQPLTEATGEAGEDAADKPTDEAPEIGEDEKLKEEIADLKAKRNKAKEDADYWRRAKREARDDHFKPDSREEEPAAAEPTTALKEPQEADFETYDEYNEAKSDFKIAKGIADYAAGQAEKESQGQISTFMDKLIIDGKAKYEDFEDVALPINVPITVEMVDILRSCDNPVEVAYHLGNNINVCASIARMTREAKVREMTKIDLAAGSSAGPAPAKSKTVTSAPAPISPTRSENVVTKDPDKMTQAEYEQWRGDGGGH